VDTAIPGDLEGARQERLRKGLASREGVEAFRRILRERLPQVLVARGDLEARRQALKSPAPAPTAGLPRRPPGRHARPSLGTPYEAPRDDVERTIAGVWREILGFDEIGVNDSFFDLGGHSLLATQIVNRLRETFPVRLSLESLFEAPTIAGLARALLAGESRPGQFHEIARLAQGVDRLSEDEMQRLLRGAKAEGGAA
jgi:acyl carrier protein